MKESDGDIRCPAQERSDILDHAMGVLRLVNGQKNAHRSLLVRSGQGERGSDLHIIPLESADTRGLPGPRPIVRS
jgi:hypothetical protein